MSMMEIGKKDTGATQYIDQRSEGIITSQQLTAFTSASDELLLATHGRTFHFAARFLSPQHRHLVIRLYAFFRTLDDLVDKPAEGSRIEDIRKELDAWKGWFAGGLPFPAPQEPLGSRVASVL